MINEKRKKKYGATIDVDCTPIGRVEWNISLSTRTDSIMDKRKENQRKTTALGVYGYKVGVLGNEIYTCFIRIKKKKPPGMNRVKQAGAYPGI